MKKIAISFGMMACVAHAGAQSYVDLFLAPNDLGVKCASWTSCEEKRMGYGFRVGTAIQSEWIDFLGKPAIEVGYQKFGKVTSSGTKAELYFNGSTKPNKNTGPFNTLAVSSSATADALTAAMTFGDEVLQGLNVVGKIGVAYTSATVSATTAGAGNGSFTENHIVPIFGLGADFEVYEGISLIASLEFTRIKFEGDSSRVGFVVMGMRAKF
jgi:opacity protein-like surface antigen